MTNLSKRSFNFVGLFWLAGIPREELQKKLSSPKNREMVNRIYNKLEESFNQKEYRDVIS